MTKGYGEGMTRLVVDALRASAAKGKTRKEAAEELGIHYNTVCKYAMRHQIAFREKKYEFSGTNPYKDKGRCQFAVRLSQDVYASLVEEAKARGLSVGVAACVLLEELLSVPASRANKEAAE